MEENHRGAATTVAQHSRSHKGAATRAQPQPQGRSQPRRAAQPLRARQCQPPCVCQCQPSATCCHAAMHPSSATLNAAHVRTSHAAPAQHSAPLPAFYATPAIFPAIPRNCPSNFGLPLGPLRGPATGESPAQWRSRYSRIPDPTRNPSSGRIPNSIRTLNLLQPSQDFVYTSNSS